MDIKELKNLINEDIDNIKKILESIGCDRIVKHSKEYRCAKNLEDTNPTRVVVKIDENLTARIYDLIPIKGDIFVIIMELKKCSLNQAIRLCCHVLGIKYDYNNINKINNKITKKAFGGFFSNIKKDNLKVQRLELITYDDSILNQYINKGSIRFFKDGISYEVQTDFNIMYDTVTNRIVVPWRNTHGQIIGIMGRYNESAEYCEEHNISKWLPLPNLSFPKSQVLYGFYENYRYILQTGIVYVGESEKFVLQARSFGVYNTVAVGSHDISEVQRELLISLGVNIVTCMDNGIPDEFNAEQCKRLKSYSHLVSGKVGFVMNDDILEGKESPTDRGLNIWLRCVNENNILWV